MPHTDTDTNTYIHTTHSTHTELKRVRETTQLTLYDIAFPQQPTNQPTPSPGFPSRACSKTQSTCEPNQLRHRLPEARRLRQDRVNGLMQDRHWGMGKGGEPAAEHPSGN